jgi:hypothetical protein
LVASSRGTTLLGELAVFDANDVGGDPGGGSAIAGEGPVRGPERWKMRSSTAKLLRCMSPEMPLRVISRGRSSQVAFGEKRTSTGRQSRLVWSRMTQVV